MRFHFRASIKPIFENLVFRAVSGPFHPLYETKISNRSLSVVYGSITLKFFSRALGTGPHQWFNRRNEIKKKAFLGHPTTNLQIEVETRTACTLWSWRPWSRSFGWRNLTEAERDHWSRTPAHLDTTVIIIFIVLQSTEIYHINTTGRNMI